MNVDEYIEKIGIVLNIAEESSLPSGLIIEIKDETTRKTTKILPDRWGSEKEIRKGQIVQIGIFDQKHLVEW